jgi:hypothetical protein
VNLPRQLLAISVVLLGAVVSDGITAEPPQSLGHWEMVQIHSLVATPDGHVWALKKPGIVQEWDGKQWGIHPLPPRDGAINQLLADNHNQVWAMRYTGLFLWRPNEQKWQEFPEFTTALEQCLRADPKFALTSQADRRISFSGDGRVVLLETAQDYAVVYFDGHGWRKWLRSEVPLGYPQFDDDGVPVIRADQNIWQFDGVGWWQSHPYPDRVPPWPASFRIPQKIQQLAAPAWPIVSDNDGGFWYLSERRLFRARPGLRIPFFGKEEPDPFADGRSLRAAAIDRDGNIFLTTNHGEDCVFISSAKPRPKTQMHAALQGDSLRIRFGAEPPGQAWFTWRFDDGNWSEPSPRFDIALDFLPNGKHSFEARAIDEHLQIDPGSVRKEFSVAVDRAKEVTREIALLLGKDFSARNEAVVRLSRQPVLALPVLRKARARANDNQRWWIDATLQEIGRSSGASPAPRAN